MSTASLIELSLWLLIAASLIAMVTSRLRIPYTVALVIGGFAIDFFRPTFMALFGEQPGAHLLTPEIILLLFLPPLLFEAGINIELRHLRENLVPIVLLAVAGVLLATVITGYAVHWVVGIPLAVALVFGALISATDPVSVLALFKDLGVSKRLSMIVEGESLFNDGTAVVVFQIVLLSVISGDLNVLDGVRRFLVVSLGGAALGLGFGYLASKVTEQVDDARIEITLTTILAYGSYLVAEHLHLSGVIATVMAGLMVGNFGAKVGMSASTRVALWSFWGYISFVMNSFVFLLIGMEVHILDMRDAWKAILLAIGTVLLGRAISVYALASAGNLLGAQIPRKWQHLLVWGGIHGGVSLALALSLAATFPYRSTILAMTFGVVAFSIIVQGLTVKPFLRLLGIEVGGEDEYDRVRVQHMALLESRKELERLADQDLVSPLTFDKLRQELEARIGEKRSLMAAMQQEDQNIAGDEMRIARSRLIASEKSAIRRAVAGGLVSSYTADKMLADADRNLEELGREKKRE